MQTRIWKPPINRWMGTDYSKLAVINACRGVLTFAGLTMLDRSGRIPVVTFPTIVTVSSCRKMPALQTNASADTSRQLVQFHVESALSCVEIAIAFWNKYTPDYSANSPLVFRSSRKYWIVDRIMTGSSGLLI